MRACCLPYSPRTSCYTPATPQTIRWQQGVCVILVWPQPVGRRFDPNEMQVLRCHKRTQAAGQRKCKKGGHKHRHTHTLAHTHIHWHSETARKVQNHNKQMDAALDALFKWKSGNERTQYKHCMSAQLADTP